MTTFDEHAVEVEFSCGHKMVYTDTMLSNHGEPKVGQMGWCRQCPNPLAEKFPHAGWAGLERKVVGLYECKIRTTVEVLR